MAYALITPSSRGLGLALTRHLLLTTPPTLPIIATSRTSPATTRSAILDSLPSSTNAPARLDVQPLDFTDERTIADLASYLHDRHNRHDPEKNYLRFAMCVPGRLTPERSPQAIDAEDALSTLKLNLLAPMLLAKHLIPLMPLRSSSNSSSSDHLPEQIPGLNKHHALLAFMSARVGSISDNNTRGGEEWRKSEMCGDASRDGEDGFE
ncbi:MAG: hypothetical protein Q9227_008034 [Pyrenula ochraceoflavens]